MPKSYMGFRDNGLKTHSYALVKPVVVEEMSKCEKEGSGEFDLHGEVTKANGAAICLYHSSCGLSVVHITALAFRIRSHAML